MTVTTFTTTSLTASQLSVVWAAMDGLYGCIAMVDPATDTTSCTNGGGVVKIVDSVKDITSGTFTPGGAEVWLCQAGVSAGMTDDDQGVHSIIQAFGDAAHGAVLQQCRSTSTGDDVTIAPPTPTIPDPVVTVAQAQAQASGNATWFLSCPVNNVSYFNITASTNGTANSTSTLPVNATAGPSSAAMGSSTSFVASTQGASQHRRRDEQQSSAPSSSSSASPSSATSATSSVSTPAPSPTNGNGNGTVSSNSTANGTNASDPYAPFIANHTMPLNFTKAANFSLAPNLSLTSVNMSTGLDLLHFNYSMCYWNPGPNTTNSTDGTDGKPANAARSLGVPLLSACAALLASAALAVVTL